MKYFIWVCVFTGFLLSCIGIFTLLGNITRGVMVEREFELRIPGSAPVKVAREVEFNELPEVVMTLGMTGLLITMAVSYISANAIMDIWDNDDRIKTRNERFMRIGIFIVCFFAFSFIFGVHQVADILTVSGYIFLLLTCTVSIITSNILCRIFFLKQNNSKSIGNEEVSA